MLCPKETKRQQLLERLALEWSVMKTNYSREDLVHFDNKTAGLEVRIEVPTKKGELDWFNTLLRLGSEREYSLYSSHFWSASFLNYDWEKEKLKENITQLVDSLISEIEEYPY